MESIFQFVSDFLFWSILIFAGFITVLTLFVGEVSDYLGGGIFNNFFIGKYHHPREEERIFMFLDMNSSTTIAEKIGHKEYFQLLRTYYADIADAIIQTVSYVANIAAATKFRYKFEITNITAGSLRLFVNKPTFTQIANVNTVGEYEFEVEVSPSNGGNFYLYATNSGGNTFQGTIDNVSVIEVVQQNASNVDMCMQVSSTEYEWINITQNNWI
jgi:hypothetical protein